jgi:hypothetical protein
VGMNGCATIAAASLFFTAISQATQGQETTRAPLSSGHPLVGSWWAEFPKFKCSEEFEIRADGTRVSRSGEERNESEFVITPLPSAKGYYKFTDRITKNNGKRIALDPLLRSETSRSTMSLFTQAVSGWHCAHLKN